MRNRRDRIMGVTFLIILGVSCLYVYAGTEDTSEASVHSLLDWTWNNYDLALEKAQPNKYVLIDFWAVWCTECKEMDKKAFRNPEVVRLLKDFVLLKVDVDTTPQLRAKFAVGGLPVLVVVNSEGEEVARAVGYQTTEQVIQLLQEVLTQDL